MDQFLFEDGKGNLLKEEGKQVFVLEMEVDKVEYPLENITDYDKYMDQKPPEKPIKIKQEKKIINKYRSSCQ
jgi:hypothetical protein